MNGKIVSWKDDKGFGFITADGQSERIFFHISSVKKAIRKPEVGDTVLFEVVQDPQGRLKATHVLLEGVSLANSGIPKKIITEPVKKDAIDYLCYFILIVLLVLLLGLFVKTGSSKPVLVLGVTFTIILFFILSRKKQPASKLFSCSKCRTVSNHDERTVLAWNKGLNRLYCKSCHQAWLREKPADIHNSYSSSNSGCLGLFLVIALLPIFCIVGAITWFV